MEYTIVKFAFSTDVRFGELRLSDTEQCFRADTLFSALCQEALRRDGVAGIEKLADLCRCDRLSMSDGMPFCGSRLYIPKPMLAIQGKDGDSEQKKAFKKLKYIPLEQVSAFAEGCYDITDEKLQARRFGRTILRTRVAVHPDGDNEPYAVAGFRFDPGCGLYVILGCASEDIRQYILELLDALSLEGIGGKKSSGMGKFKLQMAKLPEGLEKHLRPARCAAASHAEEQSALQTDAGSGICMLLSVAMARDDELEEALHGASYVLRKRSGYIQSETYAEQFMKKRELYMFQAGSCFTCRFGGDVFDVSSGGRHPVYRYGKPMFLEVSGWKTI